MHFTAHNIEAHWGKTNEKYSEWLTSENKRQFTVKYNMFGNKDFLKISCQCWIEKMYCICIKSYFTWGLNSMNQAVFFCLKLTSQQVVTWDSARNYKHILYEQRLSMLFFLYSLLIWCPHACMSLHMGGEATTIQLILTIYLRPSTYKSIYLNVEPATLQFTFS